MNFNLKNTEIFKAVSLEKRYLFNYDESLKKIFRFSISIFAFLYIFALIFDAQNKNKILGLLILSAAFWIFFETRYHFFNLKIKKPKLKTTLNDALSQADVYNLAEFLDFDLAKMFLELISFSKKKKFPEITPPAFLEVLIKSEYPLNEFLFNRLAIREKVEKKLKDYFDNLEKGKFTGELSKNFQEIILQAADIALEKEKERIEVGELLLAAFKIDPFFERILIEQDLKELDISDLVFLYESSQRKILEFKEFWKYENLSKHGSIAKDWAAGYTYYLDQYSIDLTDSVKKWILKEIIGHQKEIAQTERILSRTQINNVLIVGDPGTGRKSIIEAIARKCFLGKTLPSLNHQRVVEIDLISFFSQIQNPEEVESILNKIFREVIDAGNVILVIDEIHNFVGTTEKRPGVIDISPILGRYLNFPQFRIVALTNYTNLHITLEQYPSLLALFEKVEVSEISRPETMKLLANSTLELEQKYKTFVTYPVLREIVNLAERYFPTIPFPKKALDLLDEVMVYVATVKKAKAALIEDVAKIVSEKTQIPVGKVEVEEKKILLNLENLIHQRIINQEEAVKEVSMALRRARAGLGGSKRPIGVFLFLGPTGVGKTETSKALADIYFGGEERMVRLDMSEFQRIEDIPRLLGKPGQEGLLTTEVKENPFSLILLDEIEKAHPNILNLFLQVFDEGWITDGQGRKIIFTNNIIIATSNAGYQVILKVLKEITETGPFLVEEDISVSHDTWEIVKKRLLDYIFEKGIFRPEFVNRFNAVVAFLPLSKKNLLDISQLLLKKLKKNLKDKGIEFIITEELKEKIVELGYSPIFGAREMKRVIQDKVENALAKALLANELKRGDKVKVNAADFSLIIEPH